MPVKKLKLESEEPEEEAPIRAQSQTIGGRLLPHDRDTEESLLSTLFLDDGTFQKAQEAGLEPESFYEQNHAIVFEAMQRLHAAGKPVEVSLVAADLKKRNQLDRVGGYGFVTQISKSEPTSARAPHLIERVRELSILRNLIRASTEVIGRCYDFSGEDIEEFISEQAARVSVSANGYSGNDDDLLARLFDIKQPAPKPDAIFSVAGVPVCTPGNLTTIFAPSKGGKTALQGGMIAATITNPTSGHDTLGFTGPNYGKLAVLHFDTEQSKHDWQQKGVLSALKRVNLKEPPPWLMSVHLTGDSAERCLKIFRKAVRFAKKKFGGIRAIFIDGVGDFVRSPNNEEECYELVRLLHATAIEHDCAIICILHLNPMSKAAPIEKGRGHLGSQLERKSESNLTLTKKGDTTVLLAEGRQRNAPIPADKAPAFRWSDEHQMHRSCPSPDAAEPKHGRGRPPTYTFAEMKFVFPSKHEEPKRIAELHRSLIQTVPIKSMGALYSLLRRFVDDGMIEAVTVPGGRAYRLAV